MKDEHEGVVGDCGDDDLDENHFDYFVYDNDDEHRSSD